MGKYIKAVRAYFWTAGVSFIFSAVVPLHLRPLLLRAIGCSVGANVRFLEGGRINAGPVSVGDLCVVGASVYLDGSGPCIIGERVHIGAYSKLISGTHSIMPSPFRRDRAEVKNLKVEVESGCWIGVGSTILPGVTVAVGCVIGAGSVVTVSTKPNGLYAGIPARRIKDLPVETCRPFEGGVIIQQTGSD